MGANGNKYNLTGQRFGLLVAVKDSGIRQQSAILWEVRCDCGEVKNVRSASLRRGFTKSCGCLHKEQVAALGRANKGKGTHKLSNHPLYSVWADMKQRCTNTRYKQYADYGGRGISVCVRWAQSFQAFYDDMAPTYVHGLSIDRIDNDGNYEPSNCRWATMLQQQQNRRRCNRKNNDS